MLKIEIVDGDIYHCGATTVIIGRDSNGDIDGRYVVKTIGDYGTDYAYGTGLGLCLQFTE